MNWLIRTILKRKVKQAAKVHAEMILFLVASKNEMNDEQFIKFNKLLQENTDKHNAICQVIEMYK